MSPMDIRPPQVTLALLADFAQAHHDGRFQIVGGGIRALTFPELPGRVERMSLAVAIEFAADQVPGPAQGTVLVVTSQGPGGEALVPPAISAVRLRPLTADARVSSFEMVVNMADLRFEHEGLYSFIVSIWESELVRIPLIVEKGATRRAVVDERPWEVGLRKGFEAFQSGRVEEAHDAFEKVTREFPGVAEAWNNLGFLLLTSGAAKRAEASFTRAAELGYGRQEVVAMNLGCALYIEDRLVDSLSKFMEAIGTKQYGGFSILHVITQAGLHAVEVPDVKAFIGLALLNAGWVEARRGLLDSARTSCSAAREVGVSPDGTLPRWLQDSADQLTELISAGG